MDNNKLRDKIIGLGEGSFRKSYYPELQSKIDELNLYKILFERTNDLILVFTANGGIVKYINRAAVQLFDIDLLEHKPIDIQQIAGSEFVQKIDDYKHYSVNNVFISAIKTSIGEIKLEVSLYRIEYLGASLIVAICRDITELLQNMKSIEKNKQQIQAQNEQMKCAIEKAREGDKLKSVFLQNLSHEIRTPLNAIVGFSDLLQLEGVSSKNQNEYIDIIQQSSEQLLNIVSNLISISSIVTGIEKIEFDCINIRELIENTINSFKPKARERRIAILENILLKDQQCDIEGDGDKIQSVLNFLIDNSLKFIEKGYIEIGCSLRDKFLEFYIKDTGIGIKKEYIKSVFNQFWQAEAHEEKFFGGTGLGLSISKGFVELMGGKIWVESLYGYGSTFYFTIPYRLVH